MSIPPVDGYSQNTQYYVPQQQPQMLPQSQQQIQQPLSQAQLQPHLPPGPPQRDILMVFNEKQQIIFEPNGDLKRKIKAYEVRLPQNQKTQINVLGNLRIV